MHFYQLWYQTGIYLWYSFQVDSKLHIPIAFSLTCTDISCNITMCYSMSLQQQVQFWWVSRYTESDAFLSVLALNWHIPMVFFSICLQTAYTYSTFSDICSLIWYVTICLCNNKCPLWYLSRYTKSDAFWSVLKPNWHIPMVFFSIGLQTAYTYGSLLSTLIVQTACAYNIPWRSYNHGLMYSMVVQQQLSFCDVLLGKGTETSYTYRIFHISGIQGFWKWELTFWIINPEVLRFLYSFFLQNEAGYCSFHCHHLSIADFKSRPRYDQITDQNFFTQCPFFVPFFLSFPSCSFLFFVLLCFVISDSDGRRREIPSQLGFYK